MSKKKTHEEFSQEVFELVGEEYQVLSKYVNAATKIMMKHTLCEHEYHVTPNKFLSAGRRCPKCAGNEKKTHEQFLSEVKRMHNDEFSIIGKYEKYHKKIRVRHNTCNRTYEVSPAKILSGRKCPHCKFEKLNKLREKTHEEFLSEVYDLVGSEYEVLGQYEGSDRKVKIKHTVCNHIYYVKPGNFLFGRRCPNCKERSLGERTLYKILKSYDLSFEEEKTFERCTHKYKLRYDFFVEGKVLIEYDGKQHFQPAGFGGISKEQAVENLLNVQYRDRLKNDFAKSNNIPLLRIPYTELNNIETIVVNFLVEQNILKKSLATC